MIRSIRSQDLWIFRFVPSQDEFICCFIKNEQTLGSWSALVGLCSLCKALFMITWGCEEQLWHVHKQKDGAHKTSCSSCLLAFVSFSLFFAFHLILFIYSGWGNVISRGSSSVFLILHLRLFLSFVPVGPHRSYVDVALTHSGHFIRNMYPSEMFPAPCGIHATNNWDQSGGVPRRWWSGVPNKVARECGRVWHSKVQKRARNKRSPVLLHIIHQSGEEV